MLSTRFVDGAPNWLDLASPDISGAQAFYRDLFGWDYRLAGPDAGGYGMFRMDDKVVAGGMTVDPDQGPPAWSIFFQSSDADATAQAAEDALADFVNRSKGGIPDDVPEVSLSGAPMGVAHLLKAAGLCASTSEAMRMVDQGGVRIDGAVVSDKGLQVDAGSFVMQVGKRKFARVTLA